MVESPTVAAWIAEGEARGEAKGEIKGLQKALLLQGCTRFGDPDSTTQATLEAITDLKRLERLSVRLLKVHSWQDLLK